MSMKRNGLWHPCRVCWAEIEGLFDLSGANRCTECEQTFQNIARLKMEGAYYRSIDPEYETEVTDDE